jgi:hypothetical protein
MRGLSFASALGRQLGPEAKGLAKEGGPRGSQGVGPKGAGPKADGLTGWAGEPPS